MGVDCGIGQSGRRWYATLATNKEISDPVIKPLAQLSRMLVVSRQLLEARRKVIRTL